MRSLPAVATATLLLVPLAAQAPGQTVLQRWDGFGGQFGGTSRSAGDLNSDGHADVIVGQSYWANPFVPGEVHVYSGADGSSLLELTGAIGASFGFAVAGLGDVDGDGAPDLAVGAPLDDLGAGSYSGGVHVHSGASGALIRSLGGAAAEERFGSSLATVGDADGDGVGDLAVGSAAAVGLGRVSLYSGANGALIFEHVGATPLDGLGIALDGAGDVDGDGRANVVAGIPNDSGAASYAGRVQVLSGLDGAVLLDVPGMTAFDRLGSAVAGAGDVDGDGAPDVLIGAGVALPGTGFARLVSGSDGHTLLEIPAGPGQAVFARAVAGPGDLDRDGVPDLLVSGTDSLNVYSGAGGALLQRIFLHVVDLPVASVAGAGDIDADGYPDLLVSGNSLGPPGCSCGGQVLAVSGVPRQRAARTCFGDGSEGPCPCGNPGRPGHGCASSTLPGARLHVEGTTSVAADDLTLLLLYGTAQEAGVLFAGGASGGGSTVFGDGLRCAASPLVRVGTTRNAVVATWGTGLAAHFGWGPGEHRVFQAWYRDPSGPCGSGSNLSNAVDVTFAP